MSTETRRGLAFGLNEEVPAEVQVCWGARWIFPDDMVYDRQDFIGIETPDGQKLKEWLNGKGKKIGAIRRAMDNVKKTDLRPNEDRVAVLYEDEYGIIKGNPRSSHGYLYVCAYLKQ